MKLLPSGLAELVGDEEPLARFLTSSGHYSSESVRHRAFLPNPKDGETSVFRHGAAPREALWQISRDHLPGVTIHGAAVLPARCVREDARLDVHASEPPPRHAAIHGWPWLDDPELQKAQQKERALVLAHASALIVA